MAGRQKKKKQESDVSMERWMISYADFITLLMVFFIIMYAMSKVDTVKYAAMANSLSVVLSGQSLSVLDAPGPSLIQGISGQQLPEPPGQTAATQAQLDEVKKQIQEFINSQQLESSVKDTGQTSTKLGDYIVMTEQERGLVISFKDALLFSSGSDVLNSQARGIIKQVGISLNKVPNFIRVEGHTDNLPINTPKFPSNWELSVLRASNVVHVLAEDAGISPDRLSVIGYGEYRPLVNNVDGLTQSMNRRVDIVVLKKKYDYFEPDNLLP
ncbi:MAG: flagellar motor protein MotB [Syntrophomonas sp.]|nr:flagellar motor protein MotB [Syntrophomonas sp.]